MKNYSFFWISF